MKEFIYKKENEERINFFLRDQGIGSRRAIDDYITKGFVTINNKQALLGSKLRKNDVIKVKTFAKDMIYALYNKPRGETTSRINILPMCEPVGRLDKESEGLLLYTNDFRVVDRLLNPTYAREKEYEVTVREKATPRVVTILKRGITTQEATYAPVKSVAIYNEGYSLRIILTEGKKHEIRRMLNALNLTIVSLKRVRIMSFVLRGIPQKGHHLLTKDQTTTLLRELDLLDNTNDPSL
ncbi:MAG: pseudouridylate synthase specific to ribosomal small subunit, rRNA pseudouridine2604 synthase [Candidatus Parcubacteria bacterium]|jgi:pseudouridine synthase